MKNLEKKIADLQKIASRLEPGPDERSELRSKVMKITDEFLNNLSHSPAYIGPDEHLFESIKGDFNSPTSDHQRDKFLNEIRTEVDISGINPASGNHLGYVPGGGLYTSALGDYWAAITNRYSGVYFANPGAVKIENELIRWMIRIVGYPKGAWGNLASGGSLANLTAIVAAREALKISPENVSKSVIYLTDQTHHCILKAIKIAGLHHAIIHKVELDKNLKMDPNDLENIIIRDKKSGKMPFLIISTAGTTDAGAIDPIEEIQQVARKHKIWHHIDAAYGGFFLLTDIHFKKLKAMSLSDSLVMDPHKSLFLPYGLGVVLIRDSSHMFNAFAFDANYMQDAKNADEEISPADVSPELTKHFRGLRMWLPLKIHGLEPFKASLEEKYYLANYFYKEIIKIKGFQVYMEPELTVVMFRYQTSSPDVNSVNKRLIKEIHKDGRVFLSSTTLEGDIWLRVAILVFRTHKEAIDLTLRILKEKVNLIS